MHYSHTQKAPLGLLIALLGIAFAAFAFLTHETPAIYGMAGGSILCFLVAGMIHTLTVADTGRHLTVRFGPIPAMGTKIQYTDILTVEPARSNILDGWGIHWAPGKGWIYNLWGFDCVRFSLQNGKCVRIGTDDAAGLIAFVQSRTQTDKSV